MPTVEQRYEIRQKAIAATKERENLKDTYEIPAWLKQDIVAVIERKKAMVDTYLNKSERLYSISKWEKKMREIEVLEEYLRI